MLLNLSNHPSINWSKKQLLHSKDLFASVLDLPFPIIAPNAAKKEVYNLARKYASLCKKLLSKSLDKKNAVHIMGEHTFVFYLVTMLKKQKIKCVASTTSRNSKQNGSEKLSLFNFVKFREY